jgi:thiol-disulfide isomerase/thioredoxin
VIDAGEIGFRRRGAAVAILFLVAIAGPARALPSPDGPITRSPDRLAGEVDAKGLLERIAREKGNVVLVNFWATWCVPCREEFPEFVRLQAAYAGRGLRVIGISTDLERDRPAVEKFLTAQKSGFPNYRRKSGGDPQQFIDTVDTSWGGELPFTVLYARDGRKAMVFSGKRSYAEYERELRRLLEVK